MEWQVLDVGPESVLEQKRVTRAAACVVERPANGRASLILAPPSAREHSSLFEARAHVVLDGDDYLIIAEASASDDRDQHSGLIVRAEPGEVVVLDTETLERVAQRLIDSLERGRPGRLFRPLRLVPGADCERALHLLAHDCDGRPIWPARGPAAGLCRHRCAALEYQSSFCGHCGHPSPDPRNIAQSAPVPARDSSNGGGATWRSGESASGRSSSSSSPGRPSPKPPPSSTSSATA